MTAMGHLRIGVLAALAAGGCGGGNLTGEFATAPGSSVLTPAIRKVTLTSNGGGFHGSPPAGAACDPSHWSYTLPLDTKRLAFTGCRIVGDQSLPESYVPAMDDFSITDAQFETATAAVRAVTVSANRQCGADADFRELRVESAGAALTYGDDFYSCVANYDHFVTFDGLSNLASVFFGIGQ